MPEHPANHRLSPVRHCVLNHSPEAHQNFEGSTPELCSGVHQKGCDLEEVEGKHLNTTHTIITFKTMTTINTELLDQELNFDELQEVNGGILILAVPFIIGEIEKASNT